MDGGTSATGYWEVTEVTSSTDGLKRVLDGLQEVADEWAAKQERLKPPICSPERKRLDSYAVAALTQRAAMVSGAVRLAHRRRQSRKLVRRYNRR